MAIIKRNGVDFDTELGGAVLHHKDPKRVEAAIKAVKTRKRNANKPNEQTPVPDEKPALNQSTAQSASIINDSGHSDVNSALIGAPTELTRDYN